MPTNNSRIYTCFVCSCIQCPKFKTFMELPYNMYDKISFPTGYCKNLEKLVINAREILPDCPLDKAKIKCKD